jgi:hypothetical protein
MSAMPMAITKAVPFVMAVFLLFTPPLLARASATSGASKLTALSTGPGRRGDKRLR